MCKVVLVLALASVCAAQLPHDTVEVALEKAAHLDAVVATHARNLGLPIIPSTLPVVRTSPVWKSWDVPAIHTVPAVPAVPAYPTHPLIYRHNLIHQVPTPIVPVRTPLKTVLHPVQYTAPVPLLPTVKLYDDGQYHQDIAGRYIKHFVPAPLN